MLLLLLLLVLLVLLVLLPLLLLLLLLVLLVLVLVLVLVLRWNRNGGWSPRPSSLLSLPLPTTGDEGDDTVSGRAVAAGRSGCGDSDDFAVWLLPPLSF